MENRIYTTTKDEFGAEELMSGLLHGKKAGAWMNRRLLIIAGCIATMVFILISLLSGGSAGRPAALNGEWESVSFRSVAQDQYLEGAFLVMEFSNVGTREGTCRLITRGYGSDTVDCSVHGNTVTLTKDDDRIDLAYTIDKDQLTLKGDLYGEGDITIILKRIR